MGGDEQTASTSIVMMSNLGIEWRRRALLSLGILLSTTAWISCESNCPQAHPCPPAIKCDFSTVTLSQLDATSRDRLKKEVQEEIQDDLKAQWKREWLAEAEREKALAQKDAQDTENEKRTKEDIKPVRTPRKSRPTVELEPTQPIEKDDRGMKVMRQAFATSIVRRLPVDERDAFTIEDASVFCFVEISSNDENERYITIKFTHSTGLTQSYELPIGQSPAWRTWSKLNLTQSMTGAWLCEVFNEDGVLLASKPFTVE